MSELHLELHHSADLAADGEGLHSLAAALLELGFGPRVRVLEYERDRHAVEVDLRDPATFHRVVVDKGSNRGPVFDRLNAASPAPHERRFGEVIVRGAPKRTWLTVRFDEYVPAMPIGAQWLFSNSVSFTTGSGTLASSSAESWVRRLLTALAGEPSVLWGAAYDVDEFRESNLLDDDTGMRALGRDVRRSLPGLFWLNVFGPPFLDLIGRDVVRSAPAAVTGVGESMIVKAYPTAGDWCTDTGRHAHEELVSHLGRRFFFDRRMPDRDTVAPDFGLPALNDDRAMDDRAMTVFTPDGRHFTVVPRADH